MNLITYIAQTSKNLTNGWAILNYSKGKPDCFYTQTISTSIHELYTFHDKIGTGKFSIVYRAVKWKKSFKIVKVCKKDNKEYAIKVIDKNKLKPEEKEFLLLETSVMKVLDHPHVIKLIDTIETKSIIYIITEIVKDGDLFDFIINNEFLEGNWSCGIVSNIIRVWR
jgi:Serine/threonine protein kinase